MPSLTICRDQCGARCCRAPGSMRVSLREADRLQARALGRGQAPVVFRKIPGHPEMALMNFSENGGQCPMLGPDSACTIYAYRPVACHRFPEMPMPGCRVWPEAIA